MIARNRSVWIHGQSTTIIGLVVQLVRTLACHARGRRFEPDRGRHYINRGYSMDKEPKLPSKLYVALAFLVYVAAGVFVSAFVQHMSGAH